MSLLANIKQLIAFNEEDMEEDNVEDMEDSEEDESIEIDSCPMCDSENVAVEENDEGYCIKCDECGHIGNTFPTLEEAVNDWNE